MVDSPLVGWGVPTDEDALVPLNACSPRLENSRVVKTGPGYLFGFTVTNTLASAQYVQIFDATTLPADGAVPILAKSLTASDATGFLWYLPRTFLVGLVICNSTTQGTKTLGSANCLFDVQFI